MEFDSKDYTEEQISSTNTLNSPENYQFVKNNVLDRIGDKYKIQFNQPLDQYNNFFSQCYAVSNLSDENIENIYVALLNKSYPARLATINYLKKNNIENLICPIDAEIVTTQINNQQNLGIILPKPSLVSLKDLVQSKGSCSISFITNNILLPISLLIEKLADLCITHGKINPDNIFLKSDGSMILGECVSELCGYSQKYHYEPIDRMECLGFAKGSGDISTDYFALGVTCLYAYLGREITLANDIDELRRMRFEEGSYKTYIGNLILPLNVNDLIKGLLLDKNKDRWRIKQIMEWYDSKRYAQPDDSNSEAKKHIIFNNRYYLNTRYLAYDFHKNWEIARTYLKEDHLIKWVERSMRNINLAENLSYLIKTSKTSFTKVDKDILMIKVIAALDSEGPIRVKGFAVYPDAVCNLIAFGFSQARNEYLEAAMKIIGSNLWRGFINTIRYERKSYFNNLLAWLDNCKKYIENKNLGFGLERCLYELNKFFPCQSLTVSKEFITNIKGLLESLDDKATDVNTIIMDRHIAAFIMSRISYDREKILANLKNFPNFYNDRDINALAILAIAQKETNIKTLTNLAKNIASNFCTFNEHINNRKSQAELNTKLSKYAEEGALSSMLRFVCDTDYIKKDIVGFKAAIDKFKNIEHQKTFLADDDKIYQVGYQYGLKLTVIISYLLCTLIFLFLISKI